MEDMMGTAPEGYDAMPDDAHSSPGKALEKQARGDAASMKANTSEEEEVLDSEDDNSSDTSGESSAQKRMAKSNEGAYRYRAYSHIPPSLTSGESAQRTKSDEGAYRYRDYSHIPPSLTDFDSTSRRKGPSFPEILHIILSTPEFNHIISWLPHGRAWRINKLEDFEVRVIPLYFKHGHFSSFARQVNGWGFLRRKNGTDLNSYWHELFLRGMPHLCHRMKRVAAKHRRDNRVKIDEEEVDFYALSHLHPLPEVSPLPVPPAALNLRLLPNYPLNLERETFPAHLNVSSLGPADLLDTPRHQPRAALLGSAAELSSVVDAAVRSQLPLNPDSAPGDDILRLSRLHSNHYRQLGAGELPSVRDTEPGRHAAPLLEDASILSRLSCNRYQPYSSMLGTAGGLLSAVDDTALRSQLYFSNHPAAPRDDATSLARLLNDHGQLRSVLNTGELPSTERAAFDDARLSRILSRVDDSALLQAYARQRNRGSLAPAGLSALEPPRRTAYLPDRSTSSNLGGVLSHQPGSSNTVLLRQLLTEARANNDEITRRLLATASRRDTDCLGHSGEYSTQPSYEPNRF